MTDSQTVYRGLDFKIFLASRFLSTTAMMVQSVAVGWQVYAISHAPLALGLVGLCEFVPMFLLTLPAGDISDRVDQRVVLALSLLVEAICAGLFIALTLSHPTNTLPFYAVLALFGLGRAFSGPAGQSLLPFIVPPQNLPKGIALELVGVSGGGDRGPSDRRVSLCARVRCRLCGVCGLFFRRRG